MWVRESWWGGMLRILVLLSFCFVLFSLSLTVVQILVFVSCFVLLSFLGQMRSQTSVIPGSTGRQCSRSTPGLCIWLEGSSFLFLTLYWCSSLLRCWLILPYDEGGPDILYLDSPIMGDTCSYGLIFNNGGQTGIGQWQERSCLSCFGCELVTCWSGNSCLLSCHILFSAEFACIFCSCSCWASLKPDNSRSAEMCDLLRSGSIVTNGVDTA